MVSSLFRQPDHVSMRCSLIRSFDSLRSITTILLVTALTMVTSFSPAYAGLGIGRSQAVGGVMIDPDGNVRAATPEEQREMASLVRVAMREPNGDAAKASDKRIVSLAKLQTALRDTHETGKRMEDELVFLAGLQRIEFVIVDEENNDILLAGPAEPWELRNDGSVVGQKSGGSVLRLDDLVTAFQSVETARNDGGIRCSIEPTPEGRMRLQNFLKRIKLRPGQNPAFLEAGMREAFGPQMILLAGVPTDSRFARTLVAADFEMKRIAMGLTDSPIPGLPSYLEVAKNKRQSSSQSPRWWMACDYAPMAHDETGRVWKLSGQGVKTMTEEDIVQADGSVTSNGSKNPLASKWADLMTAKFEELSAERPVFRDLRNVMDMAVIATLIRQEQLDRRAGIDLGVLRGTDSLVETTRYHLPKSLEPQCSFIRGTAGWTVTASGGVNLNAFGIVENKVESPELQTLVVRQNDSPRWWWDAE